MSTYIVIDDKRNLHIHTSASLHTVSDVKAWHRDSVGSTPDVAMPANRCAKCGKVLLTHLPEWMDFIVVDPRLVCFSFKYKNCTKKICRQVGKLANAVSPTNIDPREWTAYKLDLAKRKKLKQQKI